VKVAERIDIENIGEARCQQEILDKAREHVPRVAIKEGSEDIDA
jgi:hypothetical protein